AAHVELAVEPGERTDQAVGTRAQRGPVGTVPTRNPVSGAAPGDGEHTAHVDVGTFHGDGGDLTIESIGTEGKHPVRIVMRGGDIAGAARVMFEFWPGGVRQGTQVLMQGVELAVQGR